MIELYLPFPPTVNNYYVKTRNGIYISTKGKEFRRAIHAEIFKQCGMDAGTDNFSKNSRLAISVILYPKDKRKRDLDNYMKALLDAITHTKLIWEDDSQVDQLFIYRGQIYPPNGLVYINIDFDAGPNISIDNPQIILG